VNVERKSGRVIGRHKELVCKVGWAKDICNVDQSGGIYFQNKRHRISKAFRHLVVGLCQDENCDDVVNVFFCNECVGKIPLRKDKP
jgi:hypothetical protein